MHNIITIIIIITLIHVSGQGTLLQGVELKQLKTSNMYWSVFTEEILL